jgi:6-phosphogluconolactonase (cycloisomerase 2 family)
MAQQARFSSHSRQMSLPQAFRSTLSKAAGFVFALAAALLSAVFTSAQTPQQQYVYASVPLTTATSEVVGFSKDTTGTLSDVAGSPLADSLEGGLVAVDALGRFLFVINAKSNNISMLGINQDGSLAEVSGSPFAAAPTVNPTMTPASPLCLATEKSGEFLYVGYRNGNYPQQGAIIEYRIDFQGSPLAPAPISIANTDIAAAPIGMVTSPQGYLYAALRLVAGSTAANQLQGTYAYSIDPQTGQLTLVPNGGNTNPDEQTIAIDRQGRFLFDGWGYSAAGFIEGAPILSDGSAVPSAPAVNVSSSGSFPSAMLVESSGQFLYVQEGGNVSVYSINQATGALSQTQIPPTALTFRNGSAAADPMGPYIYSLQSGLVHAFKIGDPNPGELSELPNSPYLVASGGGSGGLAISGAPVQAVTGVAAALAPLSEDFGNITLGQSSGTQMMKLTNTGGEVLSLNSVSVTGTNPSDFIATSNCLVPLEPHTSCTVSIVFTPTAVGARQAILTASDTAGFQSAQLTGTGVAPQPAVTLVPGSLTFPNTAQGSTSSVQTVTITNSGMAPLHISSISPSGANFSDFNVVANNCNGANPANASCTLSVAFSPLGDGSRTASITINDDAPGSPQSVQLTGTGSGPSVVRSAVTVAPALLSFGTITQGASSAPQNVTLTSSGTAALHISSVGLSGANPTDFIVTNGCTQASYPTGFACTIGLTFTPLAAGLRTATLTIADDAPNSPQIISLSGNASPNPNPSPVLTVTGGLSATVKAGQTATYNLQLVAGFTGSVSFACTGAPAAATCTAPPQPLKVTSGTPVPFTITVATTGRAAITPFSDSPRFTPFASLRVLLTSTLFTIALLICWTDTKLRHAAPGKRPIGSGAFATLALTAILGVAGCGGGSTVAQSAPVTQPVVTPQGTSTITVTPTATANGAQLAPIAPIQLTLTVN